MKLMAVIIFIILIWAAWLFGFLSTRIEFDKGAYWPEYGYRLNKIYIWKNGSLIYSDRFEAPMKDDSVNNIHLIKAKNFKP